MAYKIQYFRSDRLYAEVFWDDDLPDTRDAARNGIKRNRADYAIIIDLDQDSEVVEKIQAVHA
ncbi:MAG TPA: hypothetical protein VN175_01170 [Rhizomicrobium sp.]|nr:hypothetical protein [Rhizomicrobium sp.]